MSRLAAYRLTRRWALALTLALVPGVVSAQPTTTRVSVGPGDVQGNDHSYGSALSADGRWVAFESGASNLVAGDTNGTTDVFVRDQQTGTITRVSVGPGDAQGNSASFGRSISADGRWVAFQSQASNLVAADTNGVGDVFVRDRQSGITTLASVGLGGAPGTAGSRDPAISADGRWVAFTSEASNLVAGDTNAQEDVFVRDLQTGTTTRVTVGAPFGTTEANGFSVNPAISADGRWVAFESLASNLVAGDTNGMFDVFVYDRHTGTTSRASVGPGGAEGNYHSLDQTMSADGRWVTFYSQASNLVAGDTNGRSDAFIYDRIDAECDLALAPTSAVAPPAGATNTVQVGVRTGCGWTAVSNDPAWLSVTSGSSGAGSGTVTYSVTANPGGPRTGSLAIWGQVFPVHQPSATTPETPTGLVASSIVGNLVTLRWTIPPGGPVPTDFVLEGGVSPGQVLASIPTGTSFPTFTFTAPSGSFYVRMHALSGSIRSAASNEIRIRVNVPVAPSSPANLLGMVNGSTLALAWTNTYAGGTPTSLVLEVFGAITTSVPLGLTETFSFVGVPPGTYTFRVQAQNAAGSSGSGGVGLTFPGSCSGAPQAPVDVLAYRVGRTVFVSWASPTFGVAPTSYVLNVTGSFVGSFPAATRALSGTVGPGSYTLSVAAVNACGASATSVPQTVVVP